jgi:peroxiredoxin-like protein
MSSTFRCQTCWTAGADAPIPEHDRFSRDHLLSFADRPTLEMSSAPDFLGNPARLNPEELLVGAISSCQMLTFLAIAARARLSVLAYSDEAEGVLERNESGRFAITRVHLRPRIVLAPGTDLEKASKLVEKAHQNCFIASSVRSDVIIEPSFVEGAEAEGAAPGDRAA